MSEWPTVQQVINKVREVAAATPERAYQSPDGGQCLYVHPDAEGEYTQPGCMFGRALMDLGVSAAELHGIDWGSADTAIGYVLRNYATDGRDDNTADAAHWCGRAQTEQDLGLPWAEAVAVADNQHPGN